MRKILICTCFFFLAVSSFSQNNSTIIAGQLAKEGKYHAAIRMYSDILESNPGNNEALLGRAYAYSWSHRYLLALTDFVNYLQQHPEDNNARTGIAYAYAWSGDFSSSQEQFSLVLQVSPGNIEAEKGLAYLALWKQDSHNALNRFGQLITKQPTAEFYIAQANAYIQLNRLKDARRSLDQALSIEPSNPDAKKLKGLLRVQPAFIEADGLAGYSSINDDSKTGLRLVQLAIQPTRKLRLMGKYDNTLSLDNLALINRNILAPYYAGSVYYQWCKNAATRIEYGVRTIGKLKDAGHFNETQLSGDQVFYFNHGKAINIGGALFRQADTSAGWLITAGYHHPIGKSFVGGVQYFFSSRENFDAEENRFLVTGDYTLPRGGIQFNAGIYAGHANSNIFALEGRLFGAFLKMYVPVTNMVAIHLMGGLENNYIQNLYTIQAGLRIRLER